jgi:PAS domain S-box-containing protein
MDFKTSVGVDAGHTQSSESEIETGNSLLERVLRGQSEMLNEVRQSLDLLESIVNAMDEATVVADTSGRIWHVNRAAVSIFNAPAEHLLGRSCGQLLAEGTVCPHHLLAGGHESEGRRSDVMSRAGDRLLEVRVAELSAGGRFEGYLHVIRDVTLDRAIERRLAHADRLSLAGRMISMFAHEASTPLGVIINATDLLLRDKEMAPSNVELLKRVRDNGNRIVEMLRSMLNLASNRPANFADVDLSAIAREAIDLMRYDLEKARIRAIHQSGPDLPRVVGDRVQLLQVLINLIRNAGEAMREGGELVVRIQKEVSADGIPKAVIKVDDTGPGISPGAMERLFDFFYTTKDNGTGLGLAIARQIVERHGGEITAHNLEEGGARFIVRLPAAIAGLAEDRNKPAPIVLAAGNRRV